MSQTSHINAINLQVYAQDQAGIDQQNGTFSENKQNDDKYYLWHGTYQTIPMGMDGEPEIFAQKLKEALPTVNTLRLPFNEFSFNEDGSLHPEYERFLTEAVEQGFQLMLGYFGGEAQRYGYDHPEWSSDDIYEGLQTDVFPGMAEAWTKMMAWLDAHPDVKAGVYGYELANEPAAYERGVRRGDNTPEEHERFMEIYANHMEELKNIIEPQGDEKILVGGWNYSAQFNDLAETMIDGVSALDLIREKIGDSLVWSAHNYPGWHGSSQSGSLEEYEALLGELYDVLGDDDVIVTELHVQGPRVDEISEIDQPQWLASRTYEWYAERGIGGAWFPGAETGASNLVVIDANRGDGEIRYLHPGSLGHAMNLYSLDETLVEFASGDVIVSEIVDAGMRNEEEIVNGEPDKVFDDIDGVGFAFGYQGNDTLTGHDRVNDYLYGGQDDDHLSGFGADDYLFGQYGHDTLFGGAGKDMLFGGDGDDELEGGLGENHLEGGAGADRFVLGGGGFDIIRDFQAEQGDVFVLDGEVLSMDDILRLGEAVDFQGRGVTNDFLIEHPGGGSTLILNFLSLKAGEVFDPDLLPPATGDVVGTEGEDVLTESVPGQVILGLGGDDEIRVTSGDNKLYGGDDRDEIYGGSGNDSLYGGEDNDVLLDRVGVNHFFGGGGNDRITIQDSGAVVRAGIGNDRVIITAEEGASYTISGEGGKERFEFGVQGISSGRATITDFDEDDTLMLNGATLDLSDLPDDVLFSQVPEGRLLTVSDGFEILLMDPVLPPEPEALNIEGSEADDVVSHYLNQTTDLGDTIFTYGGADTVVAGAGDDVIDTGDDRDRIVAGAGNDEIYAGGDNDEIETGLGNDLVYGGGGNDKIVAQGGANILFGDEGNDRFIVGQQNDSAQVTGGEGNDRLIADHFEGAHTTLTGGAGKDSFEVSSGEGASEVVITDFEDGDSFVLNGVVLDANMLLSDPAQRSFVWGGTTVTFEGGGAVSEPEVENLTVEGTSLDDTLSGGEGDDVLIGFEGDDRFTNDGGADLFYGGADKDVFFMGTSENDVAYGGDDNDRFVFQSGTATLYGGSGNDRFVFEPTGEVDVFVALGEGRDKIEVVGDGLGRVTVVDFDISQDSLEIGGESVDMSSLTIESQTDEGTLYVLDTGLELFLMS